MPRLFGPQRMILQAISDAQGDTGAFVEDLRIALTTKISPKDVRQSFLSLDSGEYLDLALTENGISASLTPLGRLVLGLYTPFPTPSLAEPPRSRSKTGRERALVIGVSDYSFPIRPLPALANEVRQMAVLLGSEEGQFSAQNVLRLTDEEATSERVIEAIEATFANVHPDDSVFAYVAGRGAVVGDRYYIVTNNTNVLDIPSSGVPLKKLKEAFDGSPSQKAFLWLDFCDGTGVITHDLESRPDDRDVLNRELRVVQGHGKLIIAASASDQEADYSEAPRLFTQALLKGFRGEAAKNGEVTINSLYDYIDRSLSTGRQRPMMFGQMTGRVVLMHVGGAKQNPS
jgi:uncharacterized caspase-like protein